MGIANSDEQIDVRLRLTCWAEPCEALISEMLEVHKIGGVLTGVLLAEL